MWLPNVTRSLTRAIYMFIMLVCWPHLPLHIVCSYMNPYPYTGYTHSIWICCRVLTAMHIHFEDVLCYMTKKCFFFCTKDNTVELKALVLVHFEAIFWDSRYVICFGLSKCRVSSIIDCVSEGCICNSAGTSLPKVRLNILIFFFRVWTLISYTDNHEFKPVYVLLNQTDFHNIRLVSLQNLGFA